MVRPLVRCVDAAAELLREEIEMAVFRIGEQTVKGVVKHADDFGALVTHDGLLFLVVEGRHREAAFVVGLGVEVDVAEVCAVA